MAISTILIGEFTHSNGSDHALQLCYLACDVLKSLASISFILILCCPIIVFLCVGFAPDHPQATKFWRNPIGDPRKSLLLAVEALGFLKSYPVSMRNPELIPRDSVVSYRNHCYCYY
jgi:hypothetical protein